MRHFGTRCLRASAAGIAALLALGCVTRGTYDQVVSERDGLAADKRRLEERARMLQASTESLDAEPYPQIYALYQQVPQRAMSLVVRASGDPRELIAPIRGVLSSLDKDQPLSNVRTMDEILSASIAQQRLNTLLLGIFATLALILAGVGIYGVMSYAVKQRSHEIGVRMALGAGAGNVVRMVVLNGMTLAGIGVGVGLAAALGLTRLMTNLLFGVSPSDPATFAGISALIGLVALLACYLPARRATKVDPMTALRYE